MVLKESLSLSNLNADDDSVISGEYSVSQWKWAFCNVTEKEFPETHTGE